MIILRRFEDTVWLLIFEETIKYYKDVIYIYNRFYFYNCKNIANTLAFSYIFSNLYMLSGFFIVSYI